MKDWVNLENLTGKKVSKIPEELHPVKDGYTHADSLTAVTGCDPREGAVFDTSSMAAFVGKFGKNAKYTMENVLADPEFSHIYRKGSVYATYPSSLTASWEAREMRIYETRLKTTGEAGKEKLKTIKLGKF